jgi:D-alanine-D-alanine ligase
VGGDPLRALGEEAGRRALGTGGALAQTKRELIERAAAVEAGAGLARMESSESLPPGLRASLDVVLIMLHGPQGEDGTIQGLFELAGLPYTGAGVLASAVGMDKGAMKDLFRAHGLPIVDYALIRRHDWQDDPGAVERAVAEEIGFPCFVKPANLGSSVGVSKVKAADDLAPAIAMAASTTGAYSWRAVQGREVGWRCWATMSRRPRLPVRCATRASGTTTRPSTGRQTTFTVPAALPPATTELVRALAIRAFRAVDSAGMARVDFFIETEGRVLVNEINTIPGFTTTSAYPRLWEASGIPYPELITRLIDLALERRR